MIIPFIELPCAFIQGDKEITYKLKVYPLTIMAYLEQPNNHTAIYIQGGAMFVISMSIEEYEEAIKVYFKESAKLTGTKIHKLN
jgi:hypothetical protein